MACLGGDRLLLRRKLVYSKGRVVQRNRENLGRKYLSAKRGN